MSPKKVDAITRGLNTTYESFNYEVKTFWKERTVSRLTLISFLHLNIANVLSLVVFVAPGWGWTEEVSGEMELAGEYYGYYGVWYTCWGDVSGEARRDVCELTTVMSMPCKFIETIHIGEVLSCVHHFGCLQPSTAASKRCQ
jgi:hypothetical protein